MGDYISELPDDILCNIISYLTVREAFILRSLSSRWKDLPDTRTVLHFDAYTILGEKDKPSDLGLHARTSNFAKAVNQFLKIWSAKKTSALKIKFDLGNEYASQIDGWISSVISQEIAQLELDFSEDYFSILMMTRPDKYVFPCNLLNTAKASSLKHLRLKVCSLTLVWEASKSWLSKLTTVELTCVSLSLSDLECIMSNCFDLETLSVLSCSLEGHICVQHPCLKKLAIYDYFLHIVLSCPRLETFEFSGRGSDFRFLNVPLLREVCLNLRFNIRGSSAEFRDLADNAPQLQTLSLWVTTEVPPLPPSVIMSCLKHLDLYVRIETGSDIFSITHMVYACPVLEAFHVKLEPKPHSVQRPQVQYANRPHFHLKEVKIEPLCLTFPVFELLEYFLRNCVSLEQMVLKVDVDASTITRFKGKPTFRMWQNINPAVELIII